MVPFAEMGVGGEKQGVLWAHGSRGGDVESSMAMKNSRVLWNVLGEAKSRRPLGTWGHSSGAGWETQGSGCSLRKLGCLGRGQKEKRGKTRLQGHGLEVLGLAWATGPAPRDLSRRARHLPLSHLGAGSSGAPTPLQQSQRVPLALLSSLEGSMSP